jgi:hypothetical protein
MSKNKCHSSDPKRAKFMQSCAFKSRAWTVDQIAGQYESNYADAVCRLRESLDEFIDYPLDRMFDAALCRFVDDVEKFGYLTRDIVERDIQGILNKSHIACDPVALAASQGASPLAFTYCFDLTFVN